MTRYRVSGPIPAIYHTPEGAELRVTLPVGAVLVESVLQAKTLLGMVGVYWEERHYSVVLSDCSRRRSSFPRPESNAIDLTKMMVRRVQSGAQQMTQLPCIDSIILVARSQQGVLPRIVYDHFGNVWF